MNIQTNACNLQQQTRSIFCLKRKQCAAFFHQNKTNKICICEPCLIIKTGTRARRQTQNMCNSKSFTVDDKYLQIKHFCTMQESYIKYKIKAFRPSVNILWSVWGLRLIQTIKSIKSKVKRITMKRGKSGQSWSERSEVTGMDLHKPVCAGMCITSRWPLVKGPELINELCWSSQVTS